jgi:glycine betaine/proline transport system substrate-binding protein
MIRTAAAATCLAALAVALGSAIAPAGAAEPESCATVRMSDPGWTDITSTNALLGTVLSALGYEQDVETLSVPITYESLKNQQIDAFLGSWQPAQASMLKPLQEAGQVEVLGKNLAGIRFTLAVPAHVAAAGVKSVDDLAAHADKFEKKIYGIDPGAAANLNILKMIEQGSHGLGGWELVESSEQAMLAQVDRAVRREEWVVFLGWEPHPMNLKLDMTYLSGAEEVFGPNFGASDVYTLGRTGLAAECPNLGRLLRQVTFTVEMENEIMAAILDQGADPEDAAAAWLKAHPQTVEPWLAGVTTREGGDGLKAVQAALGS